MFASAARRLLSEAQLGQVDADRVEGGGHLGQQIELEIELVRAARAVLQQGRRRVATGVHLDRVQVDVGRLDVGAGDRPATIRYRFAAPPVLRVQAVGQQNDLSAEFLHMGVPP